MPPVNSCPIAGTPSVSVSMSECMLPMSSHTEVFCVRASLEDRLKLEERSGPINVADTAVGSKQLTFTLKKVSQDLTPIKVPSF